MNKTFLTLAMLCLGFECLADPNPDIVAKHVGVFNAPPDSVPTPAMPGSPLLGNGDVGVTIGGPADSLRFYIGKNDFWTRHQGAARVITVGQVNLIIPALKGATYKLEQDMARAEVRGTFTKGALGVTTCSRVDARQNLLITHVRCEGEPVALSVRPVCGVSGSVPGSVADTGKLNIGREQYGSGRWYFNGEISGLVITNTVLSGRVDGKPDRPELFDGKTRWIEASAPKVEKEVSVAAWIRIADISPEANYIASKGEWNQAYSLGLSEGRLRWAVSGTSLQMDKPLPKGKWLYVAVTYDGRQMNLYVDGTLQASLGGAMDSLFTRKADTLPGKSREVAVATRVTGSDSLDVTLKPGEEVTIATAIVSDLDAADFRGTARKLVDGLTARGIRKMTAQHRDWWAKFWQRSFIEIPDKEIEKRWYAALYVMGSCSRPGKVAPGLWGNWLTTDGPNWQGDYHLNYNFEAPFYMVYSANHADISLPVYDAITQAMEHGRAMSKRHGWKGVHFPCGLGPWGLFGYSPELDHGQRSNAAYMAMNFIWYWQYTQDREYLKKTGYPYLREVAEFWEDYLKLEPYGNGSRYVIYMDAIHEGSGADMNPVLSLGLLRTLFRNMLEMSQELGVDADKRAKWQDILDRISAFPTQERDGKTVFRYTEKGMPWCNDNTLGIQHIFPAGAIGFDSDPKLLEISRNMIEAMGRWADFNGFSSWYTACARIGYKPDVILAKLRTECDKHSLPNLILYYGGGGIESCGGFLAINEMMLQSHENVIRFFPCWPRDKDARFGTLRAVGAFLVSAQIKDGTVDGVELRSEKGRDCTVQNPWPGAKVVLIRNGRKAEILSGDRFTFKTAADEVIQLKKE